jgi:cytosine/adenosine deaminase-related metal-dependent hydrolase
LSDVDLLIVHATVMTVDATRRIIADGALAIAGDRIVEVGKTDALAMRYRARRVVDATDQLVMPGLINAHQHLSAAGRGVIPDGLDTWTGLRDYGYPLYAAQRDEDVYYDTLALAGEMIRHGITCFQEPNATHMPGAVRAVEEVGMRASIGPWNWDQGGPGGARCARSFLPLSLAEALARAEAAVRDFDGAAGGRVRACVSLEGVSTCSDALTVACFELAAKLGTICVQHKASSPAEVEAELRAFGQRPVEHLHAIGALGPHVVLNHMTCLDPFEVDLLARSDARVIQNPSAALKLSKGTTQTGKWPELVASGVTVGLGVDSTNSSNFCDVIREMYLAALLPRDARTDATAMTAEKAIEMATIDGARALGWDAEIGSLEVGKKADVIAIETRRFEWRPLYSVVNNLVYSATGDSVVTTIVDGKVLMDQGRLTTLDEARTLAHLQARSDATLARAGIAIRLNWPVE